MREFTHSGVQYAKGRSFPYREIGVIEFDLRGLWLADLVEFPGRPYAVAAKSADPSDDELERLTAPAQAQVAARTAQPPSKPQPARR